MIRQPAGCHQSQNSFSTSPFLPGSSPTSRNGQRSARPRHRVSFKDPLIRPPPTNPNSSVVHTSRLSKINKNIESTNQSSSACGLFFQLLCKLWEYLQSSDYSTPTLNTDRVIAHPTRVERSPLFSSDDEEDDLNQNLNPYVKPGGSGFRGGFRWKAAVNSWIAKELRESRDPCGGGGDYYQGFQRGWGQSQGVMTRLISLPVARLALFSRLLVLGIQIFANNLLGNVRHYNDGFRFERGGRDGTLAWDPFVQSVFGGFANWDGQYFLHIAVKGYTYENILAFFPLFPMTVSYLAWFPHLFLGWYISFSSLVLVVSWILNATLFMKTANMLAELVEVAGVKVSPVPVILLFCFNPASIFFSGVYTESMFMYLTMKLLLALYDGKPYKGLVCASLSSLCRSNGILNFGFVAAYFIQDAYVKFRRERKNPMEFLISRAVICVMFLLPFLSYQWYVIAKFCTDDRQPLPPYCRYEKLPYSYIQEKYWSVGPFQYFQFKQLPNFLLAAPVLYHAFTKSWRNFTPLVAKLCANPLGTVNLFNLYIAAHGLFLAAFCFVFVHVQVSTRLILSAFPYLYLYIVESCADEVAAFRQRRIQWPIEVTFTQLWCAIYFVFGTILFSLGYPWT